LKLGRAATDDIDVAGQDGTHQRGSPFGSEELNGVGRVFEGACSFDTLTVSFNVLREGAEWPCRAARTNRVGWQGTRDHRIGRNYGPRADLDAGHDDRARPDVARRVDNNGPDTNGAQPLLGASIVRKEHALGTKSSAVAHANERTVFGVDKQIIRKDDVSTNVHAAISQALDSMTPPDGGEPRFQARDQLDRV